MHIHCTLYIVYCRLYSVHCIHGGGGTGIRNHGYYIPSIELFNMLHIIWEDTRAELMGYPTTSISGNNVRKCMLESDFY